MFFVSYSQSSVGFANILLVASFAFVAVDGELPPAFNFIGAYVAGRFAFENDKGAIVCFDSSRYLRSSKRQASELQIAISNLTADSGM